MPEKRCVHGFLRSIRRCVACNKAEAAGRQEKETPAGLKLTRGQVIAGVELLEPVSFAMRSSWEVKCQCGAKFWARIDKLQNNEKLGRTMNCSKKCRGMHRARLVSGAGTFTASERVAMREEFLLEVSRALKQKPLHEFQRWLDVQLEDCHVTASAAE